MGPLSPVTVPLVPLTSLIGLYPVLCASSVPVGGGPDQFLPDGDSSGGGFRREISPKPRLLLADDDALMRKAVFRGLSRLLNLTEPDFASVDGLESARRVFDLHADDLQAVVTDMNMPHHGDGLRLYRHVRAAKPFLPVVILSGGMREVEERALDGILASDTRSRFFDKPVEIRFIADWIHAHWSSLSSRKDS